MIKIKEATIQDNEGLLELGKISSMEGEFSMSIDRSPDFFRLLKKRGEYKVFIAKKNEAIIGSVSLTYQKVLINGKKNIAGQIGDMKIHPEYRGGLLAFRLISKLSKFVNTNPPDLLYCHTINGNKLVESLLNGRIGLPKFHFAGHFMINLILSSPKKKYSNEYKVVRVEPDDINLINTFLKQYYSAYNFTPEKVNIDTKTISGAVYKRDQLVGVICLADTSADKQNIITAIPPQIKFVLKLNKLCSLFFPLPKFPEVGDAIKMLYVKHIGIKDDNEKILELLIQFAKNIAFTNNFSFLTAVLHEQDGLSVYLRKQSKFQFKSNLYVADFKEIKLVNQIKNSLVYEDFSIV